jgi:hypothetical protein
MCSGEWGEGSGQNLSVESGLGIAAEAERSDPPSDDRQPGQRAQGLGKEQEDEEESRGGRDESGDHERRDERYGASVGSDRSTDLRRDLKHERWW